MSSDRPPAHSFRDLRVWQKAHEFVLAVYRYSDSFPEREKFGLTHQLRRAAVSIPEYCGGFPRRVPVLFDSVPRLGLRPERVADQRTGRNQQAAQRLRANDPGFWLLIFWLHIPEGYQGRSPWLVRCGRLTAAV